MAELRPLYQDSHSPGPWLWYSICRQFLWLLGRILLLIVGAGSFSLDTLFASRHRVGRFPKVSRHRPEEDAAQLPSQSQPPVVGLAVGNLGGRRIVWRAWRPACPFDNLKPFTLNVFPSFSGISRAFAAE